MTGKLRLSDLGSGKTAVVSGFQNGSDSVSKTLKVMGLTRGLKVEILNRYMGRDPILIRVRNGRIALRQEEAALVFVEGAGK